MRSAQDRKRSPESTSEKPAADADVAIVASDRQPSSVQPQQKAEAPAPDPQVGEKANPKDPVPQQSAPQPLETSQPPKMALTPAGAPGSASATAPAIQHEIVPGAPLPAVSPLLANGAVVVDLPQERGRFVVPAHPNAAASSEAPSPPPAAPVHQPPPANPASTSPAPTPLPAPAVNPRPIPNNGGERTPRVRSENQPVRVQPQSAPVVPGIEVAAPPADRADEPIGRNAATSGAANIAPRATESRDAAAAPSPASTRALQVDVAIKLENLGQSISPAPQTHQPPHSLTNQSIHALPAEVRSGLPNELATLTNPFAEVEEAPLTGQFVRGLTTALNQRGGVLNMRLDPPELGELRIHVTMTRGVVTAEFQASTLQAQHLLERNLATLRSTLENQGLNVERLTVHAGPTTGSNAMRHDYGQNGNADSQRQPHHDAAGGESRGRREQNPGQPHRHYVMSDFESVVHELSR